MVNDPTQEREEIGGREPMGDPAETDPQTTRPKAVRKSARTSNRPDQRAGSVKPALSLCR